jgi:hypothetical protein
MSGRPFTVFSRTDPTIQGVRCRGTTLVDTSVDTAADAKPISFRERVGLALLIVPLLAYLVLLLPVALLVEAIL